MEYADNANFIFEIKSQAGEAIQTIAKHSKWHLQAMKPT